MLDAVRPKTSAAAATGGFDVEILSVATANPSFQLSQAEATRRASRADWTHFATWCEAAGVVPLPAGLNFTTAGHEAFEISV